IGTAAGSAGGLSWDTPDAVGNSVRVKLIDATETVDTAEVYAPASPFDFSLIEEFSGITPKNGMNLTCGGSVDITWLKLGDSLGMVDLYLSKDGGLNYSFIKQASNTGSTSWDVPTNVRSAQCKIRVVSTAKTSNSTGSTGIFVIKNGIDVQTPTIGTPPWSVGSTYLIDWNFQGPELKEDSNPVKVKVEYSPTGLLVDYDTIPGAGSIDIGSGGYGSWVWDIGASTVLTTVGKIKVTDTDIATGTGESLGSLIIRGDVFPDEITTNPASPVILKVGENQDVTWTVFGGIQNVNLYYKAGTGSWTLINTSGVWDAATQPYGWIVNDAIDNAVFLKLEDAGDPSVFNITVNTFRIIGKVALSKPGVAEPDWVVATTQNIQWTPTGTYTSVKIEGSNDDFVTTWPVSTQPAGTSGEQQTLEYTVSDHIGDNVKLRIFDSDATRWDLVLDTSPGFTIKGVLAITTPIVEWFVGQTNRTIQWNATGTVGNVHLEYDDGGAWHDISDPSVGVPTGGSGTGQGSYLWPAVDDAKSASCRLRVTDLDDATGSVKDTSTTFTIWPLVTVYEPLDGFNVEVQSDNTNLVKWNITGNEISQVDIYYDTDGGSNGYTNQIGDDITASLGQFSWNSVPVTPTGNARIKVVDIDDSGDDYYGESPSFDIIGKITMSQPDGNDWKINQSGVDGYSIVWSAAGIANVSAYYSTQDGGLGTYQFIGSASASAGSLDWDTPDAVGNSVKVKLIDATETVDTAEVFAPSPKFSLIEDFSGLTPKNGMVLTAGGSVDITWFRLGDSLATVDIYLSKDNGVIYTFVKTAGNTSSTSWNVPTNVRSTQCKLRIVSPEKTSNSVSSAGVFVIRHDIDIQTPTTGTPAWSVGNTYVIDWDFKGPELKEDSNPVKVKIEYSATGLGPDFAIIPGAASIDVGTAEYGFWVWDIATDTTLTTVGKIRVTDTDIGAATDTSEGDLVIRGNVIPDEITTNPSIPVILKVGDNRDVSWNVYGQVQNINLYYKTSTGSWTLMNTGGPWDASTQPYPWTVANAIDNAVLLKIEDAGNQSVFNQTANTFRIIGKISLDKPSVAEPHWVVASTVNIQWTPTGTYTSVKIEGSNDDFVTTWPVSTQPAGTSGEQQTLEYTVSDHIGDNVKLRIFDSDATRWDLVLDTSPGFTIKGVLAITTPIVEWFVGQTNRTIQWTATGTVGNVHLEYDDGSAWHDISDPSVGVPTGGSGSGQGSYLWPAVGDAKSQSCRLRVTDLDDATDSVKDTSTTFTIWPLITVYEPVEDLNVEVQSDNANLIKWNISGTNLVDEVDIYYDTDGGSNGFPNQINALPVTASAGQYSWNSVPVTTTDNAMIKVIDVDDGTELYFGTGYSFDIIGK
ncbi:hypothetical protein ACFL5X_04140, partial [Candidatus Omnitrophota bacterium]